MCQRPTGESPSTSSGSSTTTSCPTTATMALPTGEHATSQMALDAPSNGHRNRMVSGPIFSHVQDTQALLVSSICKCSPGPALGCMVMAFMCRPSAGPGFLSRALPWGSGPNLVHVDSSCWVCTTSILLMSTDVGMCWVTLLFMLPFWDVGPCEGLPVSRPPRTYHFTMLNNTKWPAGRVAWLLASGLCGAVLWYSQGPGMALCHLHTLATACLRPVLSALSFTPAVSAHAREEMCVCACECEKWG